MEDLLELDIVKIDTDYGSFEFAIREQKYDFNIIKAVLTGGERTGADFKNIPDELYNMMKEEGWMVWMIAGSHIGAFDMRIATQFDAETHTFEAIKENYDLLVMNIGLNGLDDVVHPYNFALVPNDVDSIDFYINSQNDTGTHTSRKVQGREVMSVPATNIVKEYKRLGCNCLHMDTEGMETELIPVLLDAEVEIDILLLEYHFTRNPVEEYFQMIDRLKEYFDVVIYKEDPKKSWTTHVVAYNE